MKQEILLGKSALNAGNIASTERYAEKRLAQNPHDEEAWQLKNDCISKKGQLNAMVKFAERWLERMPNSHKAYENLLIKQLILGKNKSKSKILLDGYTNRYPQNEQIIKLARCFYEFNFGQPKEAEKLAKKLSTTLPNTVHLIVVQGLAAYNNDRCKEAYEIARRAVAMAPQDVGALRLLAASAYREMKFFTARRVSIEGLKVAPSHRVFLLLSKISLLGYFPLFWLFSFAVFCGLRISGLLNLPQLVRGIVNFSICGFLGYIGYIQLVEVINVVTGIDKGPLSLTIYFVCASWLLLPELYLAKFESSQIKKPEAVNLKDY